MFCMHQTKPTSVVLCTLKGLNDPNQPKRVSKIFYTSGHPECWRNVKPVMFPMCVRTFVFKCSRTRNCFRIFNPWLVHWKCLNIIQGVLASIVISKNGNKIVRSFRPDFLLVRQNLRDANEDYRNLLLGFKYGNIPSVNSLDSIYQFQVTNNSILYYNLFTSGEADRSSRGQFFVITFWDASKEGTNSPYRHGYIRSLGHKFQIWGQI